MQHLHTKYLYVDKDKLTETLKEIDRQQQRNRIFVNVAVVKYRGHKYDPDKTVTIVIG